jgi:hypothetical protein
MGTLGRGAPSTWPYEDNFQADLERAHAAIVIEHRKRRAVAKGRPLADDFNPAVVRPGRHRRAVDVRILHEGKDDD